MARNKMEPNNRLTESEKVVLLTIFELYTGTKDCKITGKKVLQRLNERFEKDWKIQTITTYLIKLRNKGYIEMHQEGKVFYYIPLIDDFEYIERCVREEAKLWTHGDVAKYINRILHTTYLSIEQLESIEQVIKTNLYLHQSMSEKFESPEKLQEAIRNKEITILNAD